MTIKIKKAGIATLTLAKVDFGRREIIKDKKRTLYNVKGIKSLPM